MTHTSRFKSQYQHLEEQYDPYLAKTTHYQFYAFIIALSQMLHQCNDQLSSYLDPRCLTILRQLKILPNNELHYCMGPPLVTINHKTHITNPYNTHMQSHQPKECQWRTCYLTKPQTTLSFLCPNNSFKRSPCAPTRSHAL